ncbi:MAG: helix-turn-helix transcriptional regulator [Pseudomonadota bacterium]
MTTLLQLGQVLRSERQRRKLAKTALAAQSGVHRNTLQLLESGTANVELNTLIAICDVLGLSIQLVPNEVAEQIVPEGGIRQSALSRLIDQKLRASDVKDAK